MAETMNQPPALAAPTLDTTLLSSSILDSTVTKSFACELCDKVYKRNSDLKIHNRSHTGEKPYKCDQCDKAFPKRSHLTRHERTHAGIKPYRCGLCGKRHARASDLKVHLRIHTGERPYKCAICDKTFITSSHCRMHERTHDDTRCINCHLCEKVFKTRPGLKQHLNTAHNVTAIPKRPAAVVHPTPELSEPSAKNARLAAANQTALVTSDGNSSISLDTIAKLCPSAVQALLSAGVIQQKTKDAGSTFVELSASDSDDGSTDLLSGLMPFNPSVLDNFTLPELESTAIPDPEGGEEGACVPPLLNTLTACTMAYGPDQMVALWQQNALKFADTTLSLTTPVDTDASIAHSPSSISSVEPSVATTMAPQATSAQTSLAQPHLQHPLVAGIVLPHAQPHAQPVGNTPSGALQSLPGSSISLLLHAANMSQ